MSTYINFFLRKGDIFIPVGSFSRNSSIFGIANIGAWGKIAPLSRERLDNLISAAGDEIRRIEKNIQSVREKIIKITSDIEAKYRKTEKKHGKQSTGSNRHSK